MVTVNFGIDIADFPNPYFLCKKQDFHWKSLKHPIYPKTAKVPCVP